MGYNYRYTVTYWCDCDGCEIIETGFVCGDNYQMQPKDSQPCMAKTIL